MKLIEYVVDGKRATQLFDLKSDPLEMNNLANHPEYTGILEDMRTELKQWRSEFHDTREVGDGFWNNFDNKELLDEWRPGSHVHE